MTDEKFSLSNTFKKRKMNNSMESADGNVCLYFQNEGCRNQGLMSLRLM